MISHAAGRFFVIAVVTAILPSVAAADDAASLGERVFSFLDRNRDSKLDADEFARIPASMRDWLVKYGRQPGNPLSLKDFQSVFPGMMVDLRRAVKTATTPVANSGGSSPGSNGENRLYASDTEPEVAPSPETPTDRLPSDYQDGDLNKDGQIDFFEWRKLKKDVTEFQNLDLNRDSVLSVVELGGDPGGSTVADSGDPKSDDGKKPPSGKKQPRDDISMKTYEQLSSTQKKDYQAILKTYFVYLDESGNKDGKLQEKEWDASKRIKPIFVDAKINIKKDMRESEFIRHYTKLVGTKDKTWQRKLKEGGDRRDRRKSSRRR